VAQNKRQRQKARRRAQQAAVAAARKRRARRRLAARIVLGAVLVGGVIAGIVALLGNDEEEVATQNTTTTVAVSTSVASAAGKPCVPLAGTPPAGAPTVPVKVGPPPADLVTEDLKFGTGAPVAPGATVTVNYIGVSCSTGKIFDSSYKTGQPATFPLAQVIPGWQEGIPGMKVGGQRLLGIPPQKAYGPTGRPPDIAPQETLWFVVEVLDAKTG
jgi:peptidylprolyl isomerase